MRRYVLRGTGPESLAVVDVPEPVPGPGEVLLRVKAVSLNFRDLVVAQGKYGKLPPELVPCSDGAGEVVSVGPGVTRCAPGDRMAAAFMPTWSAGRFHGGYGKSALGGAVHGMLAEFVCLDQAGLVPVPAFLSDEEAATLPCAAVTAWNALFVSGHTGPGDVVLTQGTGGVSIFALQFARIAGARVLATSGSDAKRERLRELGAADTHNYRSNPNWDDWAYQATGRVGVDHVVEVGGAGTLPRSLRAVRAQGQISLIGVLTGIQGDIPTVQILHKQVRVVGIYVGSREMFEQMNRAIELHRLRPVIDRVFPFEEAPQAYQHLASGAHFGKVVIRV